ncbi:hypothetical protein PF003_g35209 [Phytophthora fragariae]|nr:hypothetical protein PF003_g35209 [Phytophthora fragariae]
MNATKRPRTLLLASRSLPCSSSDAASHAAGRRCSMQNQCRSIVSDATTPLNATKRTTNLACWPAAACHARARTPPPRCRTPL